MNEDTKSESSTNITSARTNYIDFFTGSEHLTIRLFNSLSSSGYSLLISKYYIGRRSAHLRSNICFEMNAELNFLSFWCKNIFNLLQRTNNYFVNTGKSIF